METQDAHESRSLPTDPPGVLSPVTLFFIGDAWEMTREKRDVAPDARRSNGLARKRGSSDMDWEYASLLVMLTDPRPKGSRNLG